MKYAGLDIGDVWTGVALSDALHMFARPHTTIATKDLQTGLAALFSKETISTIVVGYPKTMRGTVSDQTRTIEAAFEQLKAAFPTITWLLWDERLSSKRADQLKKARTKEEKVTSHAIAAAFILGSYLDHKAFQRGV